MNTKLKRALFLGCLCVSSAVVAQTNTGGFPPNMLAKDASIRNFDSFANVDASDGLRDGERITFDNAPGLFVYELSASDTVDGTSSGPGVVSLGPGGVGRIRRIRTGPEVYPEWWYVNAADGVTDATAAIDAAIGYTDANGGGVKLSSATYIVTSIDLSDYDGEFFRGAGKFRTTLRSNTTEDAIIVMNAASTHETGTSTNKIDIGGFTLDGNTNTTYGLDVNRFHMAKLHDIFVTQCQTNIRLRNCWYLTVENVSADAAESQGWLLDEVLNSVLLKGCNSTTDDAAATNVFVNAANSVKFDSFVSEGTPTKGIVIDDGCRNVSFSNLHVESDNCGLWVTPGTQRNTVLTVRDSLFWQCRNPLVMEGANSLDRLEWRNNQIATFLIPRTYTATWDQTSDTFTASGEAAISPEVPVTLHITSGGSLTGFSDGGTYYAVNIDYNGASAGLGSPENGLVPEFQLSATKGGAAITNSDAGSGTLTLDANALTVEIKAEDFAVDGCVIEDRLSGVGGADATFAEECAIYSTPEIGNRGYITQRTDHKQIQFNARELKYNDSEYTDMLDQQAATWDDTTDEFTISGGGSGLADGVPVVFETTGSITGFTANTTVFWVVNFASATDDTFQLSDTKGGSAIDSADAGTGTHTIDILTALNLPREIGNTWYGDFTIAQRLVSTDLDIETVRLSINSDNSVTYVSVSDKGAFDLIEDASSKPGFVWDNDAKVLYWNSLYTTTTGILTLDLQQRGF